MTALELGKCKIEDEDEDEKEKEKEDGNAIITMAIRLCCLPSSFSSCFAVGRRTAFSIGSSVGF